MIKLDSYKDLKDAQLVDLFKKGNSYAFEILATRYYPAVFSFLCSKQGTRCNLELSKDIAQDVFAKAIVALSKGKYKETYQFQSWLFRIGENTLFDHFRRENNRLKDVVSGDFTDFKHSYKDFVLYNVIEESENAQEKMETEEMYSYCMKLIEQLPLEQRSVVDLRLFKDLNFKDIAEIHKISINTALGRWRYAITNMKKIMKENPPIWLAS